MAQTTQQECIIILLKAEGGKPDWFPVQRAVAIKDGARTIYRGNELPSELRLYLGPNREAGKDLLIRGGDILRVGKPKKKPEQASLGLIGPLLLGMGMFFGMVLQAIASNI